MKFRVTTWLAALLVMSATVGLPVTRGATNRVSCYYVYCEKSDEDRAEEAAPRAAIAHPIVAATTFHGRLATRLLDHSLFQRPPPVLSF